MELVLKEAGATLPKRDAVDTRIVREVRSGTGRVIDHPSQVGGWPELRQNRRELALPANPDGDDNGNGYTNLEEYILGTDPTGSPGPRGRCSCALAGSRAVGAPLLLLSLLGLRRRRWMVR